MFVSIALIFKLLFPSAALAQSQSKSVEIGTAPDQRQAVGTIQNSLDTKVTIRANNAIVAEVLDSLSRQTKLDFYVVGDAGSRRITLFLQNGSAREALQMILESGCLTYQQLGKSNFYTIAPRVVVRMFPLKHIRLTVNPATGAAAETWLLDALRTTVPPYGKIALIPPTNSVMLSDVCNTFEFEQALAEIDKPKEK